MKFFIVLIVLTCLVISCSGQAFGSDTASVILSRNGYRAKIHSVNGKKIKGRIKQFTDSSLILYSSADSAPVQIPYKEVHLLKIRRANATTKGLAIGAASGALAGLAIEGASRREVNQIAGEVFGVPLIENSPRNTQADYMVFFGLLGAGSGAALGNIGQRYEINGNHELFLKARARFFEKLKKKYIRL